MRENILLHYYMFSHMCHIRNGSKFYVFDQEIIQTGIKPFICENTVCQIYILCEFTSKELLHFICNFYNSSRNSFWGKTFSSVIYVKSILFQIPVYLTIKIQSTGAEHFNCKMCEKIYLTFDHQKEKLKKKMFKKYFTSPLNFCHYRITHHRKKNLSDVTYM